MPDNKELVTVKETSDILNYAISLPDKKCITFGELQQIVDEMPKLNAYANPSYYSINDGLIDGRSNSYNFMLVENAGKTNAKVKSAYGEVLLTSDTLGGYTLIPNASGYDQVYIHLNSYQRPVGYRFAPDSNGNFTRKVYSPTSNSPDSGYSRGWRFEFNDDYTMNGFGYFYFIIIY